MLVFLLTILSAASACEVMLPPRMLVTGAALNQAWPFPQQGCRPAQLQAVLNVLRDQQGEIPVARLQAALGDQVQLASSDTIVRVESAVQMVRARYATTTDAQFELTPLLQASLVELPLAGETRLECHPCRFEGSETIRIDVRAYNEAPRSLAYEARFTRMVDAYRLRRAVPAFTGQLDVAMFEKVQTPQRSAGKYFQELPTLGYYKTNKSLRAGDLLREEDLIAQTLVKAGERVELFFENDLVRVKSHAVSRQNGGIGQRIEVWNQANGRKHTAKVIDQGKVVVEL